MWVKEKLHYTPDDEFSSGFYNGNIYAQAISFPSNSSLIRGYRFGYDGLNRLTSAAYGEGSLLSSNTMRYSETIGYDKNGNITSHTNRGLKGSTYAPLQTLSITLDGNRLKKVTNNVTNSSSYGSQFFHDGANLATEYIYDANGNMVQDFNKGIAFVKYNFLNLPEVVQMNNGHSVKYTYDALGRKHKQEIITLKSTVNVNMGEVLPISTDQIKSHRNVHYCGNVIYSGLTKLSMKQIMTDEGYISYEGYHTHTLKDHLGNVRAEVDDFGVQVTKNYYPYGIEYDCDWSGNSDFAYGNKELQSSHGLNWCDFGKRSLDIALGSWPTMDPLCEKYYSISPHAYCAGNPMNAVDLKGDSITTVISSVRTRADGTTCIHKDTYYYGQDANGNYGFLDKSGNMYSGNNQFMKELTTALGTLQSGSRGQSLVNYLMNSTNNVEMVQGNSKWADTGGKFVHWNFNSPDGGMDTSGGITRPSFIGLGHELAHIEDVWKGTYDSSTWVTVNNQPIKNAEKYATHVENQLRSEHNLPLRTHYGLDMRMGQVMGLEATRILNSVTGASMFFTRPAVLGNGMIGIVPQPYIY